ncbi:MAG: hypothetical protein GY937_09315 [bacterium]|nr:hypothetical protein [bacterium]
MAGRRQPLNAVPPGGQVSDLSHFEYVTVFLSILLALAAADVLAGLGRLIREREHVRIYWVHVAWMLLLILAVTQSWWAIWNVRVHELTNFFEFLLLVLPRLIWVLVAFLLSPPIAPGEAFDLREYYFRHIRWVAALAAFGLLGIATSRAVLGVEPLLSPVNGIRIIAIGILASMGSSKNPRLHESAAIGIGILLLVAVVGVFLQRT